MIIKFRGIQKKRSPAGAGSEWELLLNKKALPGEACAARKFRKKITDETTAWR
jgi:hypothetical protein